MGEAPLPFFVISKHNVDSGTKGPHILWEHLWSGARGEAGGRPGVFPPPHFPSKTRQASHWNLVAGPSAPPVLKVGDLLFHTPDCHTGAEGPRGCWESLFLSRTIHP